MLIAFIGKMAVALRWAARSRTFQPLLVAALTSASFIGVAVALWRKPVERTQEKIDRRYARAAIISFATIFFAEWGDVGQITAATLAARFGVPLMVWGGR